MRTRPASLPVPTAALHALRNRAAYTLIRGSVGALCAFSVDQNMRTMRTLGGAFARAPFNRARLERAHANISRVFPDWERDRVETCAVDAYRHLFSLGVETAFTPRLISDDGWSARVDLGDLRPGLSRLLRGRPTILITGHCGNWELLGYTLAVLGFPVHALYRPLDLKPLDDWMRETRGRRGMALVDKFGATEEAPRILDNGGMLGFIADQNAGDRGLYVPFFDRLASTYKTIGLLAMRHGASIICGQARRVGHALDAQSFRYRIEIIDAFDPQDWESQPDPLFYIGARYRRAIETMVRNAPEQYLWMHRYWKSRPSFERAGKPFPDRLREKLLGLPWMTEESLERIERQSEADAAAIRDAR
ncbi:MAG: hypothetical protein EA379_04230 [Phycisphaerales bacterium]|nr:MAG: hypothetical protein EA379_04230 [Phycisphaerales bacterium]